MRQLLRLGLVIFGRLWLHKRCKVTVILQRLDPPIIFDTPDGKGDAHFIMDYGFDHDTYWGVFIRSGNKARQFWWYNNKHVRIEENKTIDRLKEDFKNGISQIESGQSQGLKSNA